MCLATNNQPMSKSKTPASAVEHGVPIAVVHLIDAFCRRNLSSQEIEFVSGLFWRLADESLIGSGSFFAKMDDYLSNTNGGIAQVVTSVPTLMKRSLKG